MIWPSSIFITSLQLYLKYLVKYFVVNSANFLTTTRRCMFSIIAQMSILSISVSVRLTSTVHISIFSTVIWSIHWFFGRVKQRPRSISGQVKRSPCNIVASAKYMYCMKSLFGHFVSWLNYLRIVLFS